MSRQFWIYDNGEEPCLAFQDEESAKEIRRQDKIFYCRQVNPALDKAIAEIQTFLECCVDDKHNRISSGLKRYAEGLLAQYRSALKDDGK